MYLTHWQNITRVGNGDETLHPQTPPEQKSMTTYLSYKGGEHAASNKDKTDSLLRNLTASTATSPEISPRSLTSGTLDTTLPQSTPVTPVMENPSGNLGSGVSMFSGTGHSYLSSEFLNDIEDMNLLKGLSKFGETQEKMIEALVHRLNGLSARPATDEPDHTPPSETQSPRQTVAPRKKDKIRTSNFMVVSLAWRCNRLNKTGELMDQAYGLEAQGIDHRNESLTVKGMRGHREEVPLHPSPKYYYVKPEHSNPPKHSVEVPAEVEDLSDDDEDSGDEWDDEILKRLEDTLASGRQKAYAKHRIHLEDSEHQLRQEETDGDILGRYDQQVTRAGNITNFANSSPGFAAAMSDIPRAGTPLGDFQPRLTRSADMASDFTDDCQASQTEFEDIQDIPSLVKSLNSWIDRLQTSQHHPQLYSLHLKDRDSESTPPQEDTVPTPVFQLAWKPESLSSEHHDEDLDGDGA
ncbi:hypothetical protein SODALDRAFT_355747 [Sodiomyces alkalinus F11]|uniref:Uncharacterized protein n=1 Tax=Sodiomyces alkalinus (strain CBS 110278 / VKM F-3762 / F11) TaxID=1314773 RepID=A0A3N2Q9T7_SODAK|nr:hypothetical protein SODALDRAFT_355747 [Sodiomyces alkalinus F11]ROT43534.1 hypothetical protein SODALDRAFT_355747 [Sodiomyces alkalinus F11]